MDNRIIRCPVCLAYHQVPFGVPPNVKARCTACKRPFPMEQALEPDASQATLFDPPGIRLAMEPREWIVALVLGSVFVVAGTWCSWEFNGPEFLVFYVVLFLLTIGGATAVRHGWRDSLFVSCVGLAVYESVGAVRIITGPSRNMHKFGFLGAMMILGGLTFFSRASSGGGLRASGDSGGSGGSGCGGGGCGGGGCGGGGCGGCGG